MENVAGGRGGVGRGNGFRYGLANLVPFIAQKLSLQSCVLLLNKNNFTLSKPGVYTGDVFSLLPLQEYLKSEKVTGETEDKK
jgi:hypothetical protein